MVSVVLVVSCLLVLLLTSLNNSEKDMSLWIPSILLMLAVPAFLLWILLHTYYVRNGVLNMFLVLLGDLSK